MTWKAMLAREPELAGIARACKAARQQAGDWVDFEVEHASRIHLLASRLPTPALRSEAISTIYSHLYKVWTTAMDAAPSLPWDSRPSYVGDQFELFEQQPVGPYK